MIAPEQGLYPEGELAQTPLATPLRKPRIMSTTTNGDDDIEALPSFNKEPMSAAEKRRKHESYDRSGSVFLITGAGKTLKLPIPSDSLADPLGWPCWKRAGAFFTVYWYSVVSATVTQAASRMLPEIALEFQDSSIQPWNTKSLVTAPTLFLGIGAFVWIPMTIGMGRRPVFLLASLVMLIATVGAGSARTFHQLLACMCFLGLGQGFALTVAILIVIDMSFIDERPKTIALLWAITGFFGTGSVAIVPYVSDHGLQWRQYYNYGSIPMVISFLLVFFLYPETYFKRPTVAFDGLILVQSATEKLTVFKDIEVDSELYRDLPEVPREQGFRGTLRCLGICRSPFASWTSMGRSFVQIAFCMVNPLIFWVFVAAAFNFLGMMFIGTTYSRILRGPPYNLPSPAITPINLASAFGALLAYPIGILPVSKLLNVLTKRNGGVREAEHYLVGLIMPIVTGAMSTLLYGAAIHFSIHLSAYYIAYGLNGFARTTFSIGISLWVTEAFPRWAAPALAVVGGGGYLISFCLSFALNSWVGTYGCKSVGIQLAVSQLISGLIALPIAFWGKSARQAINGRWANDRGGALRPL